MTDLRSSLGVSACTVALLAAFLAPGAARAQTETQADQDGQNGQAASRYDGDIVVTAQRRSESLQDVPIAITAMTGDTARALGFKTSADIAAQVPNLTIKQSFANSVPQIFLRGVGINDPNANANGAVGIYVDDVNLVSPSALTFSLYDTERIEVLRGPQGTLYGRNTTGGAINFISRRPKEAFEGFGSVQYGRFDSLRIESAASLPIAQGVAARISGIFDDSDGPHLNRVTGHKLGGTSRWALRGQLSAELGDTVSVLFNLHGGRMRSSSTPFEMRGTIDPSTGGACDYRVQRCTNLFGYVDEDGDPFAHDLDFEGRTRLNNIGGSVRIDADLADMTLTSISAYEKTVRRHREDADASPQNFLNTAFYDDNRQFSQELRLASDDAGPLTWLLGGFYSHENTRIANRYDFFRGYRATVEAEGFPGGFDPDGLNSNGYTPFLVDQQLRQKASSYAAFVNADFDLNDQIQITGGARYTAEKRSLRTTVGFEEPGFFIPLVDNFRDSAKFKSFSGKIGINYRPTSDILAYASVSRGFKSGGFNGALVFSEAELKPFRPEKLTAYEAGFKLTLADGQVTANGAAFYYDYSDIQLYTFASSGGIPIQLLDNAGSAELYGAEFELTARPANGLTIAAGSGLLKTKIKEYANAPGPGFEGNSLTLAPELTLNGLIRFEMPVAASDMKVVAQTDAHYQSRVFFSASNSPLLAQTGYALWNARIALAQVDDVWEVAGQVRNILAKEYITEAFDFSSSSYNLYIYGAPRSWELSVTYRF